MNVNNNNNKNKNTNKNTKSTIVVFVLLCVALVAIAGTVIFKMYGNNIALQLEKKNATTAENGEQVIEISEKLYVSWFNEIAASPKKYLGKTIRIEGMFNASKSGDKVYYNVYRNYSGSCPLCAGGSSLGLEFTTDDGKMPEENDWIEVIGTLDRYMEGDQYYYTLNHAVYTVKEERGLETVLN